MELQNWIRGLGFPESLEEIYDLQEEDRDVDMSKSNTMDIYSDGTLSVLNSNQRTQFNVEFTDMFPYNLSDLSFDATNTDTEYFTAEVDFKYTIYNITDPEGKRL